MSNFCFPKRTSEVTGSNVSAASFRAFLYKRQTVAKEKMKNKQTRYNTGLYVKYFFNTEIKHEVDIYF